MSDNEGGKKMTELQDQPRNQQQGSYLLIELKIAYRLSSIVE